MPKSYKELIVWQKGIDLVKAIYKACTQLPKDEIYGISGQMKRAAISIPSNIAEGQQRKNLKEFLQFLRISYGSAGELDTQIIIAKSLFAKIDFVESASLLEEVRKMLISLIKKLETNN